MRLQGFSCICYRPQPCDSQPYLFVVTFLVTGAVVWLVGFVLSALGSLAIGSEGPCINVVKWVGILRVRDVGFRIPHGYFRDMRLSLENGKVAQRRGSNADGTTNVGNTWEVK